MLVHEISRADISKINHEEMEKAGEDSDSDEERIIEEKMNMFEDDQSLNSFKDDANELMQSKRNASVYPHVQLDDSMLIGIMNKQPRMTLPYAAHNSSRPTLNIYEDVRLKTSSVVEIKNVDNN